MPRLRAVPAGDGTSLSKRLVTACEELFCGPVLHRLRELPLAIVLPDGSRITTLFGPARFQLRLRTHRSVLGFATGSSLMIGDLYRDGELEVEGDLFELLVELNRLVTPREWRLRAIGRRLATARAIGPRRAARNVRHHYELDRRFYEAWLDPTLNYTCAYFADADTALADAQIAKMELVCRKLRLRAGDRVVEAGSGWGGLAIHMAESHGARVRAFNVSAEQVDYARELARARGLQRQVEFVVGDYREITESADAFVSVGMLEHVGVRHYTEFGAVIARALGGSGRALLHTIGRTSPHRTDRWIERRIFPGGYAPSPREWTRILEPNGLTMVHLENLRDHYATTLGHWCERFDRAVADGTLGEDSRLHRAWRLYLAASRATFLTGWSQLYQVLVVPWRNVGFRGPEPMTGSTSQLELPSRRTREGLETPRGGALDTVGAGQAESMSARPVLASGHPVRDGRDEAADQSAGGQVPAHAGQTAGWNREADDRDRQHPEDSAQRTP